MYWLIKALSKSLCILPRGFSLKIGEALGHLFYIFSRKNRAQALKNIRLVFPDSSFSEVINIAKRSFKSFGISLTETLRLPKEIEAFKENLIIEDKERFDSLAKDSAILVGIHSGSWELLNSYIGSKFPYVIIVRRQRKNAWDRFLNELRTSQGLKIVYEDELKSLVNYLKRGYALGIVFDHGSRDSNFYSEFFKKILPTPLGALKTALNFKRKIFAGILFRESASAHRLEISLPFEVKSREDFPSQARALNSYFENFLRKNPFEYLWWYKRFKRAKNLNVLVLSDRIPGHLKQSLNLTRLIEEARKSSFIEVVDIKLSNLQRWFLDICNLFSSPKCFGCFRCLRLILGRDFEKVFRYADVVLSCGASLSSLNRILAYNLGAKSFVIQKPNLGLRKFDLVVLPSHDKAPNLKNIVRIKGSLSFFSEREIEESQEKIKEICKDIKEVLPKIGIFIGGALDKNFNKKSSLEFLRSLREIGLRNSWQLFITTSRRTPSFLEEFLEKEFKDIGLLIIANKKNYPFVSLGIIGLCDVVLVSSDSVSMITEAASSKPTLVFDAFGVKKKKHQRFLRALSSEGYVRLIDETNLERSINSIIKGEIILKKLDNRETLEESLYSKL